MNPHSGGSITYVSDRRAEWCDTWENPHQLLSAPLRAWCAGGFCDLRLLSARRHRSGLHPLSSGKMGLRQGSCMRAAVLRFTRPLPNGIRAPLFTKGPAGSARLPEAPQRFCSRRRYAPPHLFTHHYTRKRLPKRFHGLWSHRKNCFNWQFSQFFTVLRNRLRSKGNTSMRGFQLINRASR